MKIKMNSFKKIARLVLVSALVSGTFSAAYAMQWEGRRQSSNVLDCRGSLVCGDACDAHRTDWQGVQCFFGIL